MLKTKVSTTLKLSIIVSGLLILLNSVADARIAKKAGTRSGDFLRNDAGARHVAMGGTYAGYGDQVFSLHGQPAAIARRTGYEMGLEHNEFVAGVDQQFVGLQGPLGKGRWALTGNFLGSNDLEKTTDNAAGQFGSSLGSFDMNDLSVSVHYARPLSERLSGGVAVKYIESKIDNTSATTIAFDLGARYTWKEKLILGASVTNLGRGMQFISTRSDLPTTVRLGASYRSGIFLFASEMAYANSGNLESNAGLELQPFEMLSLRLGFRSRGYNELDQGFTGGLGFKMGTLHVDYAYVPFGVLGNTHRLSGLYDF